MQSTAKIYEGVIGLIIDCSLYDRNNVPISGETITLCNLRVLVPGQSSEIIWDASLVLPNIVRCVVIDGNAIIPGRYKMHPYIETAGGFKGCWGLVEMIINKKWTR